MCVVSNYGDFYRDRWTDPKSPFYPYTQPNVYPYVEPPITTATQNNHSQFVTMKEFLELKKQVEEMKEILKIAAEYDKKTNQPHCEMEDKVEIIKRVAKAFDVDLKDIFND